MYEADVRKMDIVLTNSKNTQKRIHDFLGIEAQILYPPVDLQEFHFIEVWDYYLSFARLSDAKRVERIVEAFKRLPDKKLVVIYGENDPQKQKIFSLAEWYSNIEFITLPGNVWFTDWVGKCLATIYIPIDEDFGMSPVESMAAGKPVIWVDDGWLKETILHDITGYLIGKDALVEDIISAVGLLDREKCLAMKAACEKRAEDFSLQTFEKNLHNIL